MEQPQADGQSLRAHLLSLERQTRQPHPDLAPLECPAPVAHVWQWFAELAATRSSGMAPNPIAYAEIDAWSRRTGRAPTPFEVACLRLLDDVMLDLYAKSARDKAGK